VVLNLQAALLLQVHVGGTKFSNSSEISGTLLVTGARYTNFALYKGLNIDIKSGGISLRKLYGQQFPKW